MLLASGALPVDPTGGKAAYSHYRLGLRAGHEPPPLPGSLRPCIQRPLHRIHRVTVTWTNVVCPLSTSYSTGQLSIYTENNEYHCCCCCCCCCYCWWWG